MEEYSTAKPATSSDSASGRSNGGRLVSASAEMKNTMNIGNSCSQFQSSSELGSAGVVPGPSFCALTMSVRLSEPDAQQHGDDDEADRDLVGHHLRGRAQRAEERVLRVRRPAAHDDAVDAERGDGEQIEHADVEVGDHPAAPAVLVERDHRPGRQRQHRGHQRRQQEHALVGAGRDQRLLEHELQQVGERLQQAERPHHVGAAAQLHRRPHLAVHQQQEGDDDEQGDQQHHALEHHHQQRPQIGLPDLRPGPGASHAFRSSPAGKPSSAR